MNFLSIRIFKTGIIGLLFLIVAYSLGQVMPDPVLDSILPSFNIPVNEFVCQLESTEKIKANNEAKIIWANNNLQNKTEFVLLYLHGFSACRQEGFPVNEDFAKRYKCNAYMARLASHGLITDNPLIDMTPDRLYDSAKLALVIARHLGQKVIIMGTSTGGTLALKLAADFPDLVYGLILYAPNISIKQKSAVLLAKPWGLQIARLNFGGDFRVLDDDPSGEICKYWYCSYRAEGPVYLQQFLEATMNDNLFSKVKCPLFMGYYYKDEDKQDQIVDVATELEMFQKIGTPDSMKCKQAFPEANSHVIACSLTSKSVAQVANSTYVFAEKILKIMPN